MEGGVGSLPIIIVLDESNITYDESPQTGVDVKNEICDICGKGLKNKKTLKSHQILHQNNPGYQCHKCLVVKIIKTVLTGSSRLKCDKVNQYWNKF